VRWAPSCTRLFRASGPTRTLPELGLRIASGRPLALAKAAPHVSPWLCSLVMKCLAPEPARRFAQAGELLGALEAEQTVSLARGLPERSGRQALPYHLERARKLRQNEL
jgi:hypothetical protein